METFNQTDTKRQLTRLTEDKEKLEHTCQELQVFHKLSTRETVEVFMGRNLDPPQT